MGKLAIISDLHVDINHLEEADLQQLWHLLQMEEITHLHLAGDIANRVEKAIETINFFEERLSTTFHWGNHEMVDLSEAEIRAYPKDNFLNFTTYPLSEKNLLLGVNGWYDYRFADTDDIEEIQRLKRLFWYDRNIKRSEPDPMISEKINQKLSSLLNEINRHQQIIISTHFVPKAEFIIHHTGNYIRWNKLNAFLGSPGFGQVIDYFPNVSQVVFGHTHRRFDDKLLGNTRYSCRPFGYYYEWEITRNFIQQEHLGTNFQPVKLKGIIKANQQRFNAYKKKHLIAEFRRGMTIIQYEE